MCRLVSFDRSDISSVTLGMCHKGTKTSEFPRRRCRVCPRNLSSLERRTMVGRKVMMCLA